MHVQLPSRRRTATAAKGALSFIAAAVATAKASADAASAEPATSQPAALATTSEPAAEPASKPTAQPAAQPAVAGHASACAGAERQRIGHAACEAHNDASCGANSCTHAETHGQADTRGEWIACLEHCWTSNSHFPLQFVPAICCSLATML